MKHTLVVMLLVMFYFVLGLVSGVFLSGYANREQLPAGNFFAVPEERPSPGDHLKESQIKVYNNKVEIDLGKYQGSWARFAGSNSMDPVLDESANSIEIIPQTTDDIQVGDIIAFTYGSSLIVHRVLEIGYDELGWFARTGGDNSAVADPGKRRYDDIKYVTVLIAY